MKTSRIFLAATILAILSLLVSCSNAAAGSTAAKATSAAGATTAASTTAAANASATAVSNASATGGTSVSVPGASATSAAKTETTAASIGIREIISADEIGAIMGQTPSQYKEILKPNADRKTGTYSFGSDPSGVNTSLEMGIILNAEAIKARPDPAAPAKDSEITVYTILDAKAYLNTQYYDAYINGKTERTINSYQLVCIKDSIYYYLNAGNMSSDQLPTFKAKLPGIMEKLILNAKAKLR